MGYQSHLGDSEVKLWIFSTRNSCFSSVSGLPEYPLTAISAKLSKSFPLSLSPALFRRLRLLSSCKRPPQIHLWFCHHCLQDVAQKALPHWNVFHTQWFKIMTHPKPGAMSPTCTLRVLSLEDLDFVSKSKIQKKTKKVSHSFFHYSFYDCFPLFPLHNNTAFK